MKDFNSITCSSTDTKDYDAEDKFSDIIDYLKEEFNNDYDAMIACHDDYQSKLDAGDAASDEHRWFDVEAQISRIVFDEQAHWIFFQNSPNFELHF